MALNFSHRSIFSEDNLISPMRMGISDKSGMDNCFDYGRDMAGGGASDDDILDLLPSDPFGMDISTTFTAITGWLEDLEVVDYGGYRRDELGASDNNYQLFAELNFIWNNAMRFHACVEERRGFGECCSMRNDGAAAASSNFGFGSVNDGNVSGLPAASGAGDVVRHDGGGGRGDVVRQMFHACVDERRGFGKCCSVRNDGATAASSNFGFGSVNDGNVAGLPTASGAGDVVRHGGGGGTGNVVRQDEEGDVGADDLAPHPALSYSLSYLGLFDLLVVERVCKSLHSTVRGDPLLWRSIHVYQPLNEKITDDVLLQLTNRAQGNLHCLSLVECTRITDDGLKRVLEGNPKLTKLSVPGCTRLSIEGIVGILKAYNSIGTQGVKHLHIGGFYGVTQKHFEELRFLLGADSQLLQHSHKPHFYRRGKLYLSCDDDRALDIEVCPRCQNLRLVYDCPAESCQGTGHTTQVCRACILCIPRCSQCGRCINDSEYEETFCLELLCSSCSKQLVKCSERGDRKIGSSKSVIIHDQS